jgi:hypothetical protein
MADLEERVARLEGQVLHVLEIAEMRGRRIDALEAQLDRLRFDVDMGVQPGEVIRAEQEAKDARSLAMAALRSRT